MSADNRLVLTGHISCYPDPVSFCEGEEVGVYHGDDEYPGWVWIETRDGRKGWAPEEYLEIEGGGAKARCGYDSTELDTRKGETVSVILEISGWSLVENETGARGWVPGITLGNPEK
jgi:hypothetical protein